MDSEQKRFLALADLSHRPILAKQLLATGHIADVRAKKALMKAEAKELVMDSLKTAASNIVEYVIAAAVKMVHMPTPLDSQVWHHSSKLTLLFRQQYM